MKTKAKRRKTVFHNNTNEAFVRQLREVYNDLAEEAAQRIEDMSAEIEIAKAYIKRYEKEP